MVHSPSPLAVEPGSILRERYRVDALIGRGGMGQVFAATDLAEGGQVAIKIVSRVLTDDVLMARLHREAEAAALIRSDFVPRVLDVSQTEEGEVFLVMERLVGEPLSQRVREKGAMPWDEVRHLGEDVLRGLIDAHTAGIVHRDLKPSNVFLALKTGRVRAMILDFGVCKIDARDVERLTGTGESIGTVAYMAPEQIRGASRVDDRADLYAFGVLVFEMLTGRLPHDGPSQMAILASKLEKEPDRLSDWVRVPVPAGLDALVARALAREPAHRFASAQELLKAWRTLGQVDAQGMPAPRPSVPSVPASERETMRYADAPTEASYPLAPADPAAEPHPTQTAMTSGISLRKGTSGARLALVLAACGLVAGVVGIATSLSPAPGGPAASERAAPPPEVPPSAVAASEAPAEAPTASEPAVALELAEPPDAAAEPAPAKPRPRTQPRPAPRPAATRITTKPRY